MKDLTITAEQWDILKIKLLRKYNHLSAEDLAFEPGKEAELVQRLSQRLRRTHEYVVFTLKKGMFDLDSNRL